MSGEIDGGGDEEGMVADFEQLLEGLIYGRMAYPLSGSGSPDRGVILILIIFIYHILYINYIILYI